MDKFRAANASSPQNQRIQNDSHAYQNNQFRLLKLPLSEHQRKDHFQQMVWWYGKQLISEEDFKLQAKPKKYICWFGLLWTVIGGALQYMYKKNPETVFKRFLLSYKSLIYFSLPLPMMFSAYRWQQRINTDIYERTVGDLTDI